MEFYTKCVIITLISPGSALSGFYRCVEKPLECSWFLRVHSHVIAFFFDVFCFMLENANAKCEHHHFITSNPHNCKKIGTQPFITARKPSLRRLCFYTCLSVYPPGRYTPCVGTPPGQLHPPGQVHPCKAGTPREQCILGDTGNKRAVRILLECSLVELSAHKKMWMRPLSTVEPII